MSDFKNQSPWGSPPGGGNGGFRRGPTPPDIDEIVKKNSKYYKQIYWGWKRWIKTNSVWSHHISSCLGT